MKKGLKITGIVLASVLGLVLIAGGVACWLLFSSKGLDKTADYAIRKFAPCPIEIGRIKLTAIKTFPQIGLQIDGLVICNDPDFKAPSDTLAAIGSVLASVDANAYRKEGTIKIEKLKLGDVDARLFTNKEGASNLDVFSSGEEKESEPFTLAMLDTMDLGIVFNLDELTLNDVKVDYRDLSSEILAKVSDFDLGVRGSIGKELTTDADITFSIASVDASIADTTNAQVSGIKFNTGVDLNRPKADAKGRLSIAGATFNTGSTNCAANNLAIDFDGNGDLRSSLSKGLITLTSDLLRFSSDGLVASVDGLKLNLDTDGPYNLESPLNAVVKGNTGNVAMNLDGESPIVASLGKLSIDGTANADLKNGNAETSLTIGTGGLDFKLGGESPVTALAPEFTLGLDASKKDAIIDCNTKVSSPNLKVTAVGETYVRNWPFELNLPIRTDTNFVHLSSRNASVIVNRQKIGIGAECYVKEGDISADATVKFDKLDIQTLLSMLPPSVKESLEGISAKGKLSLNADLQASVLSEQTILHNAVADLTAYTLDASAGDTIDADADMLQVSLRYPGIGNTADYQVISTGITATGVKAGIQSASPIDATLDRIMVVANLGNILDTLAANRDIQASADIDGLDFTMDTVHAKAGALALGATYRMAAANKKQEGIQFHLDFNDLYAAMGNSMTARTGASFIEGVAREDKTKPEDDLLQRWNPGVTASLGNVVLEKLSVPIEAPELTLSANLDYCEITHSHMQIGNSDVELTGRITGIGDFIKETGMLEGELEFHSSYADVDELMALTSGIGSDSDASEEKSSQVNGVAFAALGDVASSEPTGTLNTAGNASDADSEEPAPFIVPKNVDVLLSTRIDELMFNRHTFYNMGGDVAVKDGTVVLNEIGFSSDAAEMQLTAVYKTPKPDDLYMGLDFHLLDIAIPELIDLIPSVDSIVPMLKAFDGNAQFHLAAETNLNASYMPKMPTLLGAAAIEGKNLKVLDSEMFDEIKGKLLMSKDAEPVIDSLDVEMQVVRNKVDIYPFIVHMDRYTVALGGRHNINKDLDCEYHISVLDTPLPIRLGVDISGSLEDISAHPAKHIKVTRPKYDKMFRQEKHNVTDDRILRLKRSVSETLKSNVHQHD